MSACMVSNSAYLNSRGWSTLGKFPLSSKHAPPLNGSSVQGIMEGWSSGTTGNCAFVQVGCLSWRDKLYQEPSWTTQGGRKEVQVCFCQDRLNLLKGEIIKLAFSDFLGQQRRSCLHLYRKTFTHFWEVYQYLHVREKKR